jgi:alpha-tubulin suppressor-like RCC1 family protein
LRFRGVVAGQSHSCALTLDRRAYCWGANDAGQVGTGDRIPVIYWPTEVVGGHRWLSLVAGDHHTCGITTDERTLCWGANSRGSLGYDQHTRKGCGLPDRCMAVPYPVADTTRFAELFAGSDQTCGLTKPGQLNCWGGEFGQRPSHYWSMRDTVRTTVQLRAPFAIRSIALGHGSSCILAVGGDVYCILENNLGTVGGAGVTASRGTARIIDQPMNTPLKFLALSAYAGNACGIAANGGAYCWGKLDIPPAKLPCENPQSCTMLPYRIGGELNLLGPAGAKR